MSDIAPLPVMPVTGPAAASVSSDTSRLASRANLEKAGRQFEAVFTQMMLKSMRAPHLAEALFSSKAAETFRDMQDQKLSETMATAKPLGIGKAMVDFLAKSQAALQADAAPPASEAPQ